MAGVVGLIPVEFLGTRDGFIAARTEAHKQTGALHLCLDEYRTILSHIRQRNAARAAFLTRKVLPHAVPSAGPAPAPATRAAGVAVSPPRQPASAARPRPAAPADPADGPALHERDYAEDSASVPFAWTHEAGRGFAWGKVPGPVSVVDKAEAEEEEGEGGQLRPGRAEGEMAEGSAQAEPFTGRPARKWHFPAIDRLLDARLDLLRRRHRVRQTHGPAPPAPPPPPSEPGPAPTDALQGRGRGPREHLEAGARAQLAGTRNPSNPGTSQAPIGKAQRAVTLEEAEGAAAVIQRWFRRRRADGAARRADAFWADRRGRACLEAWRAAAARMRALRLRYANRLVCHGRWAYRCVGRPFPAEAIRRDEGRMIMAIKFHKWRQLAIGFSGWAMIASGAVRPAPRAESGSGSESDTASLRDGPSPTDRPTSSAASRLAAPLPPTDADPGQPDPRADAAAGPAALSPRETSSGPMPSGQAPAGTAGAAGPLAPKPRHSRPRPRVLSSASASGDSGSDCNESGGMYVPRGLSLAAMTAAARGGHRHRQRAHGADPTATGGLDDSGRGASEMGCGTGLGQRGPGRRPAAGAGAAGFSSGSDSETDYSRSYRLWRARRRRS